MTLRTQEQDDANGHTFQKSAVTSKDADTDDERGVTRSYRAKPLALFGSSSGHPPTNANPDPGFKN